MAPRATPPDSAPADGPWRLAPTADGSWTLVHEELGQACHSRAGAWTEACERYARPCGLRARAESAGVVRLLDVGTGLGLDLAAALWALDGTGARLEATTLERDLRPLAIAAARFGAGATGEPSAATGEPSAGAGEPWHRPVRAALAAALAALGPLRPPTREGPDGAEPASAEPGGRGRRADVPLTGADGAPAGTLVLLLGDARRTLAAVPREPGFDAIFLDAFSPGVDPPLWEPAFLAGLAERLAPDGRLSTYTVSLGVRAGLVAAGLAVGRGPAVGTKSAGTLAARSALPVPLDERTHRRVARRAASYAPFPGPSGVDSPPQGRSPGLPLA